MKKASLISTRNGVAATEGEAELARLLPDMLARISTCNQRRDASHEENLIRTLSGLCNQMFK